MDDLIFDNNVFNLNKDITKKIIETEVGEIILIENFYENLNFILNEIKKLPITLTWNGNYRKNNNFIFIDGRKSYISSMKGMQLPFVDEIKKFLNKNFNFNIENIYIEHSLSINSFKKLKNYPENKYYNPHYDKSLENFENDVVEYSIVVFLNEQYEDGCGINIYHSINKANLKQFMNKDELKLAKFIQAKPNMAVMFKSDILHGQSNGYYSQFYNEWRYTQVIFPFVFKKNTKHNITYF